MPAQEQFYVFTDTAHNILSSNCSNEHTLETLQAALHQYGAEIKDNTSLLLVKVLPLNYRLFKTSINEDGVGRYKYVFILHHDTPSDDNSLQNRVEI